jgi:hypothetical protein
MSAWHKDPHPVEVFAVFDTEQQFRDIGRYAFGVCSAMVKRAFVR